MFLWKYSKIYCRKPRWLPVFYLSRSYSGIKNFTLRFYKMLQRPYFGMSVGLCFWVFLTTNLVLFCLSQWSKCVWLTAITRLFYMSQPATVEDLTANLVFPYMGQLLYGNALTSNHVISRESQWSLGISMTAFPKFCTWVKCRAVVRWLQIRSCSKWVNLRLSS